MDFPRCRSRGSSGRTGRASSRLSARASRASRRRSSSTPASTTASHIIGEHSDGTHAELIAVDADYVHPEPPVSSFEEAAAFPLVWETAYRMLVTRAGLREGEWVLCWGVGSGVGCAALVIAKALGARVVVTSSNDEKLAARELGADVTVNHASGDVAACVKEATGGRRRRRRRARRRGDVEDVARGGRRGRTNRGLRRHERAQPALRTCTGSCGSSSRSSARRWARARTSPRSTTSSRAAGSARSSTAFPLERPPPRTGTSRAGGNSGRSSSRFRRRGERVLRALQRSCAQKQAQHALAMPAACCSSRRNSPGRSAASA